MMKTVFLRNKEGYIIKQLHLRDDDPMMRNGIMEIPYLDEPLKFNQDEPLTQIPFKTKAFMRTRTDKEYPFVDFVEYP